MDSLPEINKSNEDYEEQTPTVSEPKKEGWETPPQVCYYCSTFITFSGARKRNSPASLYTSARQTYTQHKLLGVYCQSCPKTSHETQTCLAFSEARRHNQTGHPG
jgi:hypothetical protein